MAKFYGPIGYAAEVKEISPGVWTPDIEEHIAIGDVLRMPSRWSTESETTNDDLTFSGQISVIADSYILGHYSSIKYIEFLGAKWKVTGVEPKYPRLILTLGGCYNGKQA